LQKLDTSKNYYVYCRSGNRSAQACAIMGSLGFGNVYNLEGGFMEWEGEVEE
ncbi:MAG: rhodanese-like domain-containing protein, partial [Flavobacteriaceae bacterium]